MRERLDKLELNSFIDEKEIVKYESEFPLNITMAEYIIRYLTWQPGFVSRVENDHLIKEQSVFEEIHQKINEKVIQGKPIEIFFSAFAAKTRKYALTKTHYLPDAAEFLSLLHLTLIGKQIRSIYSPGMRFIIAYEGTVFHELAGITREESKKVYETLLYFVSEIERITKVKNVIQFVDLEILNEPFQKEINEKIEEARKEIIEMERKKLYSFEQRVEYVMRELLEPTLFENPEKMRKVAYEFSVYSKAYMSIKYTMGEKGIGVRTNYPNSILAGTRVFEENKSKMLSLQFLPNDVNIPYNRLAFRTKTGEWKSLTWNEIKEKESFKEVLLDETGSVFYYQEQ